MTLSSYSPNYTAYAHALGSRWSAFVTRVGLWRCSRGHHRYPLRWERHPKHPIINGRASEMFYAAGWGQLMKWIGTCSRCEQPIEWSSRSPLLRGTSKCPARKSA